MPDPELTKPSMMFRNQGYCQICESEVEFSSEHEWFRDHYKCSGCGSIPRERALMVAIEMFYPEWRSLRCMSHRLAVGACR